MNRWVWFVHKQVGGCGLYMNRWVWLVHKQVGVSSAQTGGCGLCTNRWVDVVQCYPDLCVYLRLLGGIRRCPYSLTVLLWWPCVSRFVH